jgi:glucokinase
MATAVGVDIGGTKIAGGVVGPAGLVGGVRSISTDAADGGAAVLERAISLARTILTEASESPPTSIGVATGGWIDPATGWVRVATGLLPGWAGIDLVQGFERELGLLTVALNDVHAMGLAEARLGAGRGARVCLSVAVGTGIGGAITIDGRLVDGAHGLAGAIGHVRVRTSGPICSCGRRGCIEAAASGPAIARSFARCLGRRAASPRPRVGRPEVGLVDVVDGLASTDGATRGCAHQVTWTAGALLGRVLGGVANTVDPDLIVVGGGAAAALGDPFLDATRSAVDEIVLWPTGVPVVPAGFGPDAGVVGAGLAAIDAGPRDAREPG